MPSRILSIERVTFQYPGDTYALQDINLEINENDLIVIRGESGAGKSTLLRLLNRFCDATDGTIQFHNRNIREYNIEVLREKIIYLPQLPFMVEGTVEENLSFPFSFHVHRDKQFDRRESEKWLDYFQLNVSLTHEALKLSIGQRQRIALIRAILLKPEVLLLDEPGSALDAKNKRLIEEQIETLIGSSSLTVIMATHSEVSFNSTHCREFMLLGGTMDRGT